MRPPSTLPLTCAVETSADTVSPVPTSGLKWNNLLNKGAVFAKEGIDFVNKQLVDIKATLHEQSGSSSTTVDAFSASCLRGDVQVIYSVSVPCCSFGTCEDRSATTTFARPSSRRTCVAPAQRYADAPDERNTFFVTPARSRTTLTLRQIKRGLPPHLWSLVSTVHYPVFRFKAPVVAEDRDLFQHYVWVDVTNEDDDVPLYDDCVHMRMLLLPRALAAVAPPPSPSRLKRVNPQRATSYGGVASDETTTMQLRSSSSSRLMAPRSLHATVDAMNVSPQGHNRQQQHHVVPSSLRPPNPEGQASLSSHVVVGGGLLPSHDHQPTSFPESHSFPCRSSPPDLLLGLQHRAQSTATTTHRISSSGSSSSGSALFAACACASSLRVVSAVLTPEDRVRKAMSEHHARCEEELAKAEAKLNVSDDVKVALDHWALNSDGSLKDARTLLCNLPEVLWEGHQWKPVSMAHLIVLKPDHLKKLYRSAILLSHPDKHQNASVETQFRAQRIFQALNESFRTLQHAAP